MNETATDLLGDPLPASPPKPRVERPLRPGVAQEKAELSLRLGRLCTRVPEVINRADVGTVRLFKERQAKASKLLARPQASRTALRNAIDLLQAFDKPNA